MSPQIRNASSRLWILYSILTGILAVALLLAGMNLFESICHAFTTLSAGGFSPSSSSIAGYDNPTIEWILVIFMFIAGTSFTLQYKAYTKRVSAFLRDGEFLLYLGVAVTGGLLVAWVISGGSLSEDAVRTALFQSTSLISSTGFASQDYNLWSDAARVLLIVIMLVGGCAGSAAGGPKAIRYLLVGKHVAREITRTIHPRAVVPIKYKGRVVAQSVMRSVFTLVVLYMVGYFLIGALMVLMGADLVTGFTAALACLGNIGPAYGQAGPMGSYAGLTAGMKVVLTVAMWIGRLEIITVLTLLHPHFWRNLRMR